MNQFDDIICNSSHYRNADTMRRLLDEINQVTTRDWDIMEVCGGQTSSIVKYGIEELLPSNIHLIHGPGCPVWM